MKLHAGTHTLEKSGTFEESKFSIEASSKAFFILSDGLYSNKILAVIRELSTNAYDSHIDAGKADHPFDVHLPTALNPSFYIRDYGTSMSHEDCMQLYTTYFRSTRNNSNDAVGCLGLGSKAPFAYSDSFTVDAYLDGEHRIYTAYKNENGSPVFSLMETLTTSEPNGIKVTISVKNEDVNRFAIEAQNVYEFFKVKPNFISRSISYEDADKVIEGENWFFDNNGSGNYIIMGQIAYPIDSYQLMETACFLSSNDEKKYFNFVSQSDGLRIFVKIGDVDITPSRESLSYSNQTKINIKKYIDQVVNDISVKIESEIKNQPSLFLARKKYVQINEQCYSIKNAMESLRKSISWNGVSLFKNFINESIDISKTLKIKHIEKSSWRKKVSCSDDIDSISFSNGVKFFIDDLQRGGIGRIKNWSKNDDGRLCGYVYRLNVGETVDTCSFYEMLGGATKEDVIFTSSLDPVVYSRTGSSGGGPAIQAMVFDLESGVFQECSMSVKYENAFYFTESKGEVTFSNGAEIDVSNIEKALVLISENYPDDIDEKTFYLLKPSVVKNRSITSRSNWHNAEHFVSQKINDLIIKNKQIIYDVRYSTNINHSRMSRWSDILCSLDSENVVKSLVSEYNEFANRLKQEKSKVDTLQSLSSLPNIKRLNPEDKDLIKNDYQERFDSCINRYPLLRLMNVPWGEEDRKLVVEYIKMIDNSNS